MDPVRPLTPLPSRPPQVLQHRKRRETRSNRPSRTENINAHLFSIEALMERVFDVRVPEEIEQKFRELAGELAPDPLNVDRLRLNRLLHQTPDLPDRS